MGVAEGGDGDVPYLAFSRGAHRTVCVSSASFTFTKKIAHKLARCMSNGPSSQNGWSRIFKSPNPNKGNSSKNKNLGDHLYSDNPFHRPPSAASDISEATFRTGSTATAYQSGSSGGSKDRLGDKGSLYSKHRGGKGRSAHPARVSCRDITRQPLISSRI